MKRPRYEGAYRMDVIAWEDYKKDGKLQYQQHRKVLALFFKLLFLQAVKIPSGITLPYNLGRIILHSAPAGVPDHINDTYKKNPKNTHASAIYRYLQRTEGRMFFLAWKPSRNVYPMLALYVNKHSSFFNRMFKVYYRETTDVVNPPRLEAYVRRRSKLHKVDFLTDLYHRYQEMKK